MLTSQQKKNTFEDNLLEYQIKVLQLRALIQGTFSQLANKSKARIVNRQSMQQTIKVHLLSINACHQRRRLERAHLYYKFCSVDRMLSHWFACKLNVVN